MAEQPKTEHTADARASAANGDEASGLAAAFKRARELGPQILTLQTALLDGMIMGQKREAKRLAARDESDPRVAEAAARADRAWVLREEIQQASMSAGRLVEGLLKSSLFHGYVVATDGAPAAGFVVQVRGGDEVARRFGRRTTAKTDDDGYFRFELDAAAKPDAAGTVKGRYTLSEAAARFTTAASPNAAARGASTAATEAGASQPPPPTVEVLDTNGRTVFTDPAPPDFIDEASDFRYYLVAAASPNAGKASAAAPKTKA